MCCGNQGGAANSKSSSRGGSAGAGTASGSLPSAADNFRGGAQFADVPPGQLAFVQILRPCSSISHARTMCVFIWFVQRHASEGTYIQCSFSMLAINSDDTALCRCLTIAHAAVRSRKDACYKQTKSVPTASGVRRVQRSGNSDSMRRAAALLGARAVHSAARSIDTCIQLIPAGVRDAAVRNWGTKRTSTVTGDRLVGDAEKGQVREHKMAAQMADFDSLDAPGSTPVQAEASAAKSRVSSSVH